MELIQLIQTVGPFVAIVMFFIYNEVRNRSKETEADSAIKNALAVLTTQQQTQSERDSQRIEDLSIRIDEQNQENINLRERVSAYEGAQRILEDTMRDDRDRWEKKEQAAATHLSEVRAGMSRLETQLNDQQTMIDKLESHLTDKRQEITTLMEANAALQKAHDSLVTQNELLEASIEAMTKRLKLQETERKRGVAQVQELDDTVQELVHKLADCKKQEEAEDQSIDGSQEKDVAA